MASKDEKPAPETGAATEPKSAPKKGSIVVRGPAHGRWRANRHFTAEETTIKLADLSDEDLAAIEGDPVLNARRIG
jgi:hypothetical protein